jgi:hypothetical protein
MKPHRLLLSSLLGATFLIGTVITAQTSYSDPIPTCDPNNPRCKPPIPPAELGIKHVQALIL